MILKALMICIFLSGAASQDSRINSVEREDRSRSEREECKEWFVLYEEIYNDLYQKEVVETISEHKFFQLPLELQLFILRALREQAREEAIYEACP